LDAVIEAAGALYYAETGTLGEGGLSLRTKKSFGVGTPLHIVLGKPPKLPKLDLDGIVKWLREGIDVGVQFTSLTAQDKAVISAFIKSLSSQSNPQN
jgi:Tfp pilus assembly protein PilZ